MDPSTSDLQLHIFYYNTVNLKHTHIFESNKHSCAVECTVPSVVSYDYKLLQLNFK